MAKKRIIFIGNPTPEDEVNSTSVLNVNIADNIAQKTIIEGLYHYYGKNLQVISVSDNKSPVDADIGNGVVAKMVTANTRNRITYYLSIAKNYTKKVQEIMQNEAGDDVIVVTTGPYIYMAIPALFAQWRYGARWVPFLVGAIEVPEEKFPFSIISRLSRRTIAKADGAITYVAQSVKDYMPHKPYVEIVYLIDDKLMKLYRGHEDVRPQKFTIIYTGALSAIYNIDIVLKVIRLTGNKYRWVFAGVGQYADELQQLADSTDYDVEYLGSVSNTDAIKLQKSGQLLLCLKGGSHSRTNEYYSKYAASGKLTEYLCSGVPILAGDIPAFSDTYKHFMTCEKQQVAERIVEDIDTIKRQYTTKQKLAKDGQTYAFNHFTSSYQNKNIYEFLENL